MLATKTAEISRFQSVQAAFEELQDRHALLRKQETELRKRWASILCMWAFFLLRCGCDSVEVSSDTANALRRLEALLTTRDQTISKLEEQLYHAQLKSKADMEQTKSEHDVAICDLKER